MTVRFPLGHNHHKLVEDFLSRSPSATPAITPDPKAARHQLHAAEAARNLAVSCEPSTERLAAPGYGLAPFPIWGGAAYAIEMLADEALAQPPKHGIGVPEHG
jgi:hypothetical protein